MNVAGTSITGHGELTSTGEIVLTTTSGERMVILPDTSLIHYGTDGTQMSTTTATAAAIAAYESAASGTSTEENKSATGTVT